MSKIDPGFCKGRFCTPLQRFGLFSPVEITRKSLKGITDVAQIEHPRRFRSFQEGKIEHPRRSRSFCEEAIEYPRRCRSFRKKRSSAPGDSAHSHKGGSSTPEHHRRPRSFGKGKFETSSPADQPNQYQTSVPPNLRTIEPSSHRTQMPP